MPRGFKMARQSPSKLKTNRFRHFRKSKAACLPCDILASSVFGDDEGDVVVLLVGAEVVDFLYDCGEH